MASSEVLSDPALGNDLANSRNSKWKLFVLSSAALYLEIVLIRWLGTEVKIFAFFQNLSLIVCFFGFGIGCLTAKKRGSLLPSLAATCTLVVLARLPFPSWQAFLKILSSVLSFTPDAALWGNVQGLRIFTSSPGLYYEFMALSLGTLAIFLMLVAIAMIPLGRWVGYFLETSHDSVEGYSINLAGSLVGIWLLALLAFFWLSPAWWFSVAFLLVMLSQPFSLRSSLLAGLMLAITVIALRSPVNSSDFWSPYQKLSLEARGNHEYQINVNNEGYMGIANATPESLANNPEYARGISASSYDSAFQFAPSVNRVLVVGAGAGNDVAAALRHGAGHVDAVEIDPLIATLGKRLHPEQPYQSPKVRLINNDARNFLRQTQEKYDVIIFGLLDSHTEYSGYSNVRVDNYVYTEDSFRDAKRLLAPQGILVLKFEVRSPWTWIGQRFYVMLSDVFSHQPITYYSAQIGGLFPGTVFIESDSPDVFHLTPDKASFVAQHPPAFPLTSANAPPPTTDDWPYIYHLGHTIPRAYLSVSLLILVMVLYMAGPYFRPRENTTWVFFTLGSGFLLMETQLVSRLALYFGSTWIVNCIGLTGILLVLILANLFVRFYRPKNLTGYYWAVALMLLVNYAIPWSRIPGSGVFVGSLICIAFCIPILFSGVIFTESFNRVSGSSAAFGANMLGAVAGGLAQNLSFILGMKALLIVAALIYGCGSLLSWMKPLRRLAFLDPAH